jgi:hypothetical protein
MSDEDRYYAADPSDPDYPAILDRDHPERIARFSRVWTMERGIPQAHTLYWTEDRSPVLTPEEIHAKALAAAQHAYNSAFYDLQAVQETAWDAIDRATQRFTDATRALRDLEDEG